MEKTFVQKINIEAQPAPTENVYGGLFQQYEDVIIRSLITSFGLDMFIKDQHGGNVDTIHNVRQIGNDANMVYKSQKNASEYENRNQYDFGAYHADDRFRQAKREAKDAWLQNYKDIDDKYTNNKVGFYGHTKSISSERKAELDHVIETKSINEDRGRILSGLDGVDLANAPENLVWTNKSLNASMGAWQRGVNDKYRKEHGCDAPMDMLDMKAYVEAHPELDDTTKKNLLDYHKKAKQAYETKLNREYYTSPDFFKDAASATAKLSVQMGLRQAIGVVLSEIWFAIREEFKSENTTSNNILKKIANGVKRGYDNAKSKFKEIWSKFIEGSIAGALSSLVTTLCNVFLTTAKNTVKIIRQSWASLVEATKILLWNPDDLLFGERIRAAAKILATGASVVTGYLVSELINQTPLGALPFGIGDVVKTFCGTLITGVLSCTLLYFLDRNPIINRIVEYLNKFPTIEKFIQYYKQQAALLEEYAAKLMEIDIDSFKKEVAVYHDALKVLDETSSPETLNVQLKSIYNRLNIELPWKEGTFDDFMNDKNSVLRFE